MSSSTVIKIAGDQDTLMINGRFLWAEDMSYRIWPSLEIFTKYSLAEHVLKAWARIGWLVLIFLYVVAHLCHVAWIISSYFWSVWYIQVTLNQPEPEQALGAQPEDITVGAESCTLSCSWNKT